MQPAKTHNISRPQVDEDKKNKKSKNEQTKKLKERRKNSQYLDPLNILPFY